MSAFTSSAYVILVTPYISSLHVAEKFRSFIEKNMFDCKPVIWKLGWSSHLKMRKKKPYFFFGFVKNVALLLNLKSKKFLTNSLSICYVLNVAYKRTADWF